jgi:hypothetical protein
MSSLFSRWPFGVPRGILSGGAYVPKAGRHSKGTAFDLSGFEMEDGRRWTLVTEWQRDKRTALAIEAVLRRFFPQVLGPWYDAAHQDHWHVDDRQEAYGYQRTSKADTSFVQASGLPMTGDWDAFLSSVEARAGFKPPGGILFPALMVISFVYLL